MTFTAEATDVDLKLPDWAKGKTFKDTASIEEEVDGEILSYEWSGDVSGSGSSVSTTFDEAGTYNATVTVKCDDNESVTASITVKVSKCPDCERLREEKMMLETELVAQKNHLIYIEWKIDQTKEQLRDLYQERLEIKNRIREINNEIDRITTGGFLQGLSSILPLGKILSLANLAATPIGHRGHIERLQELWDEKQDLLSELSKTEKAIEILREVLEGWKDQKRETQERIEDINKRIKEIDKDISSCRYPPEH